MYWYTNSNTSLFVNFPLIFQICSESFFSDVCKRKKEGGREMGGKRGREGERKREGERERVCEKERETEKAGWREGRRGE